MKKAKRCPKCSSDRIGYFEIVPDAADAWPPNGAIIGYTVTPKTSWLEGERTEKHEIEAYVCTSCGFLEYHVKNASTLRFDQIAGFRWANEPAPASSGHG